MKQNRGFIGISLIFAIVLGMVAAGGAYYLEKNNLKKEIINLENNKFEETKNLSADLYPLYQNLSWGSEASSSLDTHGLKLSGFKIVSKNILDGEYSKLDTSFSEYYDIKLTSLGWVRDNQFQADGAGSSSWSYTKGDERIVFSYDSTAINQKPNEPLSCPCNMVFEIFSGKESIDKTKTIDAKVDLAIFESKTFGYLIGYSGIESSKVKISGDGKNINLFPNQSNIDTLEIVDSSYSMPSYILSVGVVTFGTNQYKKFKDNITPRHTYYFISGLKNNKSIFISIENDSDIPNYLDLSSLKISPTNSERVSTPEESANEVFKKQPGKIGNLAPELGIRWVMNVDLLSYNPKWLPGVDSTGGQYINQNTKTRNLIATRDTKMYKCGNSTDGNIISVLSDTDEFIGNISKSDYKIRLFDIAGTNITAMYEQCLP